METEAVIVSQAPSTRDKCFSSFSDMRKREILCDVVIHAGKESFRAHGIVLAAQIPHFENMFQRNIGKCTHKEIFMNTIDSVSLRNIINFVYTNKLKITNRNVTSLLEVSLYLQFDFIVDSCLEFLLQRISVDNVLTIRKYAAAGSRLDVVENTYLYIRNNFEKFCEGMEFLEIPCTAPNSIRTDDLRVANEESVFEAVKTWVKANEDDRSGNPFSEKMYDISQGCSTYVSCFDPVKMKWNNLTALSSIPSISTVACTEENIYFLVDRFAMVLNLKTSRLTKLICNDKCPRGAGAALHHGRLYFFGRCDTKISKNVYGLDLSNGIYELAGLIAERRKFSKAVSLGECIYVMGGYSSMVVLKSCERYYPEIGRSEKISSMLKMRNDFDCVALNGKIYVYGHFNRNLVLSFTASTGEIYDPLSDLWTIVKPMSGIRSSVRLSSTMGKLFAVSSVPGPNAENEGCCQVEVYDPSEEEWKIGNPLPDCVRRETRAPNVLLVTNSAAQFEEIEHCKFRDWHEDSGELQICEDEIIHVSSCVDINSEEYHASKSVD